MKLLSLATLILGRVALMGYAYGIESLYNFQAYQSIALDTAAVTAMLGLGAAQLSPQIESLEEIRVLIVDDNATDQVRSGNRPDPPGAADYGRRTWRWHPRPRRRHRGLSQQTCAQSQLFDCLTSVMSTADEQGTTTTLVTKHTLVEAKKMSTKLILLAEDNLINQKVATRQLQKLGYRPDVVANGKEAIEALGSIHYDLVFMDCQMPEMDGYEATAEIRRREANSKHTPIVAMTAHAMEGDREKCIAAGMDDYITKPVKVEELSRVLSALLQNAPPKSESVSTATVAPVDVARMRDALGDEPREFAEILELYLDGMVANLAKLDDALGLGDRDAIQALAHTCAGTSANCGMNAVLKPLRDLEDTARAGHLSGVTSAFVRTKQEFARIQAFLDLNIRQPAVESEELL
ncbi:MAG: two-component system, sensor histidine kinase and response regulator [Blastocatellia bacterium]|nr:two-component system, sensor histidine kinase and response regulator [Blastocatellia bacterium]